nr:beta-1,3-N-acetylglucosaminyltransferase lunatic fringe-like [Lytechinus pictus]
MVNTGCGQGYAMLTLCCKLSIIISMFHETSKRWLCHVDDDNYLNVPNLVNLLRQYDHNQDHYIGRESLPKPKVVVDSEIQKEVQFWFATGGAGVCYSRALISKMMIYASKENLQKTCARIYQPDDVTIGFIVESLLNRTLTKVCTLNSHLQTMADIPVGEQKKQVTFGYHLKDLRIKGVNVINMTAVVNDDPTRLKSFHCTFFRGYGNCPEIIPEPPAN